MKIKLILAIAISKVTIRLCRIFNKGGTSFPGKVAQKICPNILEILAQNFTTIVVTGTNGKTTTTTIISQILKENNISHIINKSGANLEKGIITTFVEGVNLFGNSKKGTVALIESDEAAFKSVAGKLLPSVILVTNFFKDQLDRFGEVNTTVEYVKEGIKRTPNSIVVLNADDHRCASLGVEIQNKVLYYGISNTHKIQSDVDISNVSTYCNFCKNKFEYDYIIYSHIGGYSCPKCGYKRPQPDVEVDDILDLNINYSQVDFKDNDEELNYDVKINLPGIYNIYNALAAFTCSKTLKLPVNNAIKGIESFEAGFGRMESVNLDGRIVKIILVKNPTGLNEVLNHIMTDPDNKYLMFVINDNSADGRDISWLWDVNFEKLGDIENTINEYYISGIRADDMAVRLKYASLSNDKINIRKNLDLLLDLALRNMEVGEKLYILPTYTAMLNTRALLQKRFDLVEFWK